jgi:lytic murein transglycosylase
LIAGLCAAHPAHSATELTGCLASLRLAAPAHRVAPTDFDRLTANAKVVERTKTASRNQAEFKETWWDYVAKLVDDERVVDGKRILEANAKALAAIADRFGVDAAVVVAIFGVESNYSARAGDIPVLDAWLTRACDEGKPLWQANVFAAIRMLRDGRVDADSFTGSWSGAFGLTQFIPTSFEELAVDGDGDGRIDLYTSLPDALASTANHLVKRTTWLAGVPAIVEVKLPAALAALLAPQQEQRLTAQRRSLEDWARKGVVATAGAPLAGATPAYLFAPTGSGGPVFLASSNFDALLAYNNATKYAFAVGLLAQRLAGGAGVLAPWPTDDPGLSRREIRELQTLLAARGHDVGNADGMPGERTREAIRAEQQRLGLTVDGRAGVRILAALKRP